MSLSVIQNKIEIILKYFSVTDYTNDKSNKHELQKMNSRLKVICYKCHLVLFRYFVLRKALLLDQNELNYLYNESTNNDLNCTGQSIDDNISNFTFDNYFSDDDFLNKDFSDDEIYNDEDETLNSVLPIPVLIPVPLPVFKRKYVVT